MNNIFKTNGLFLLAGAMAFTFAGCDSATRDTSEAIEQEGAGPDVAETVEPTGSYTDEEYLNNYDYERDYSYEERDVVIDRVRNDLDRANQSLEEIGQRMEQEGETLSEEARQEWEETRRSLEERRTQLDQDLQELEQATEDNWENVRNDVNESLIGFEQQWEELNNREFGIEETGTENDDNQEPEVQQY